MLVVSVFFARRANETRILSTLTHTYVQKFRLARTTCWNINYNSGTHTPTKALPGVQLSVVTSVTGGAVEYHTPAGRMSENMSNSQVSHPADTIHPQHARTDMDIGTSLEATAAPPSHPVGRSSLRPGPHRCLLLSSLERRFFPGGVHPAYIPVPVLPLLPWLKSRRRVPWYR